MLGLNPQSPRHSKWQSSARVSQTFRPSYLSHLISSFGLSCRKPVSSFSTNQHKSQWSTRTWFRAFSWFIAKHILTKFTCTWMWRICTINPDLPVLRLWDFRRKVKGEFWLAVWWLQATLILLTKLLYWIIPYFVSCTNKVLTKSRSILLPFCITSLYPQTCHKVICLCKFLSLCHLFWASVHVTVGIWVGFKSKFVLIWK
jgi:hypothetical protein